MNLYSISELLSENSDKIGKYDEIFLFITNFTEESLETGLFINEDYGIGKIPLPECKSISIFYDYYGALKNAYPYEVVEKNLDYSLLKLIKNDNLSDNELLECILMKEICRYSFISTFDREQGFNAIKSLACAFCGQEVRNRISIYQSKYKKPNNLPRP